LDRIYASEKLQELEVDLLRLRAERPRPEKKPVLRPMARWAGQTLRRLGQGLESWGSPAQPEHQWQEERR
jgi:hypothetical protein